jgi:hypothetical protein
MTSSKNSAMCSCALTVSRAGDRSLEAAHLVEDADKVGEERLLGLHEDGRHRSVVGGAPDLGELLIGVSARNPSQTIIHYTGGPAIQLRGPAPPRETCLSALRKWTGDLWKRSESFFSVASIAGCACARVTHDRPFQWGARRRRGAQTYVSHGVGRHERNEAEAAAVCAAALEVGLALHLVDCDNTQR